MRPILLEIGALPIRSYGVMMAVSFVVGIWLARRRARAHGLSPDLIIDLAFVVIIASILGARATYVAVHWQHFSLDLAGIPRIWDGGLTQYGGIVLGMVAGVLFFRRRGVDPWLGSDIATPSLALGIAIGRIGCFLNGCCFGKPCSLPWAVTFPPDSIAGHHFPGASIHPTQIYASLAALAIFFILLAVEKRKPFHGFLLGLFILLLSAARFAIDPIRYYEPMSMAIEIDRFQLSSNQLMGLALIGAAMLFMTYLSRKNRVRRPR